MNKRNFTLLWIRDALSYLATTLASASVLQTLLLKCGISEQSISYYYSFTQAVNFLVSLIFADITSHIKKLGKAESIMFFIQAFSPLSFLFLFSLKVSSVLITILLFIFGFIFSACSSLRIILDYKYICEVIPARDYALYSSVSGVFIGTCGIVPGFILPLIYSHGDFSRITTAVLILSAFVSVFTGLVNAGLKPIHEARNREKGKTALAVIFSQKDFQLLIIPNFIRGFSTGLIAIFPVMAIHYRGFSDSQSVLITGIMNSAAFASCAAYGIMRRKKASPSLLCVIGSVLYFLLSFAWKGSSVLFFVILFVAYSGFNTVAYSIPDEVYLQIDESIISAYNTWRMAFTYLGSVIATALIGKFMAVISAEFLTAFSAVCLLICTLSYFRVFRSRENIQDTTS